MKCFAREVVSGLVFECEWSGTVLLSVDAAPGAEPDAWLTPGFVDLQVNGFGGVDYNSLGTTQDELWRSLDVVRATGVRRCLPTVITATADDMTACLGNLARCGHPVIAGFHVEGPHISPEDGARGAHPLGAVREPDFGEFEKWQEVTGGRVRIVTVSPHWPEAPGYVERVVKAGCVVSIGHTHATAAQIRDAVAAGASMSTHLGNAAPPVMKKFPNLLWDQLACDALMASFIADGLHLDDAYFRAALRAKGVGRSVLVTDASAPAGAAPGRYTLGAQDVDLTADGRVVLGGTERLAGSALLMGDAIARTMRVGGIAFEESVAMATTNAARAGGLTGDAGRVLVRVGSSVQAIAQ